jgi:hypothetical protein
MSVIEFRDIFQKGLEQYLPRLQRKADAHEGHETHQDVRQLTELQGLAATMVDRILKRVAERAERIPAGHQRMEVDVSQVGHVAAAHRVLEERCLALQTELKQKLEDETRLRQELLGKFRQKTVCTMKARKAQLSESIASACSQCKAPGADDEELLDHTGAAQHTASVEGRLEEARTAVRELVDKRRGLETVEEQQGNPAAPAELLLAGAAARHDMDAEDQALLDAIRKGEKACQRFQRHLA